MPYYAIYDPQQILSDQPLWGFQRSAMTYRAMSEPLWLPGVELGLRLWQGCYENHDDTWLRWVDAAGDPIATGAERAERLADQLRRLGAEPDA